MDLRLPARLNNDAALLKAQIGKKIMDHAPELLRRKVDTIDIPGADAFERASAAVQDYRIFPDNIIKPLGQWQDKGRSALVGDTILQRIQLPPFRTFRLELIAGVRIVELEHDNTRTLLAYATLNGHVERGISRFIVERTPTGARFTIDTSSGPGHWLTGIAPFFARPYQAWCTRQALRNVRERQTEL